MNKMLLSMALIGILKLNAVSLDKTEEMCEKGNFKSCIQLVLDAGENGLSSYEQFSIADKIKRKFTKKCINNKSESCKLHKTFVEKTKDFRGAFFVDGLYSGESKFSILKKKFKERKDGLFDVMIGRLTEVDKILMKVPLVGDHLEYNAKILEKNAKVKIFLTKKSERLYAVMVEWETSTIDEVLEFSDNIEEVLDSKYAKEKGKVSKLPLISDITWNLNKRATITLHALLLGTSSFPIQLIYVDEKYQKDYFLENKIKETTKKL